MSIVYRTPCYISSPDDSPISNLPELLAIRACGSHCGFRVPKGPEIAKIKHLLCYSFGCEPYFGLKYLRACIALVCVAIIVGWLMVD